MTFENALTNKRPADYPTIIVGVNDGSVRRFEFDDEYHETHVHYSESDRVTIYDHWLDEFVVGATDEGDILIFDATDLTVMERIKDYSYRPSMIRVFDDQIILIGYREHGLIVHYFGSSQLSKRLYPEGGNCLSAVITNGGAFITGHENGVLSRIDVFPNGCTHYRHQQIESNNEDVFLEMFEFLSYTGIVELVYGPPHWHYGGENPVLAIIGHRTLAYISTETLQVLEKITFDQPIYSVVKHFRNPLVVSNRGVFSLRDPSYYTHLLENERSQVCGVWSNRSWLFLADRHNHVIRAFDLETLKEDANKRIHIKCGIVTGGVVLP